VQRKGGRLAVAARGEVAGIEAPDFIISAGDLICGGIDDSCQPGVRMFLSR